MEDTEKKRKIRAHGVGGGHGGARFRVYRLCVRLFLCPYAVRTYARATTLPRCGE